MLRGWVVVVGVVAALAVPVPAGAEFGSASAFTATANARLVQVTFTARPPIGVDPLLDCARQGFHPKWIAGSVSFGPESISEKGLEDVIVMNPVFPFAGVSSPAID